MIKSMTSFGRAKRELNGRSITVEIKSVNNRYMDCTVKLPRLFGFLEDKVKSRVSSRGISRGKIDVFISIDILDTAGVEIALDTDYASSYIAALKKLCADYGLKDDISTMSVAQNRDIFAVKKADEDIEAEWQSLSPVLDEALDMFISAREREGENLRRDITEKRNNAEALISKIAPLSKEDIANQYTKLKERLTDIIGDAVELDQTKLITECAVYADKVAIDEELVRLDSHLSAFDAIVCANEPAGRKLDFLLQEINREVNTIGSKVCDARIARLVVDTKSELEKIREQVQNIE